MVEQLHGDGDERTVDAKAKLHKYLRLLTIEKVAAAKELQGRGVTNGVVSVTTPVANHPEGGGVKTAPVTKVSNGVVITESKDKKKENTVSNNENKSGNTTEGETVVSTKKSKNKK